MQAVEPTQSFRDDKTRPSPFVKWAGGKGSLLADIIPRIPTDLSEYYEPFLGGGAVFLDICSWNTSFKAHLSDCNEELINSYRVIKESPEELIQLLSKIQNEYDHSTDKSQYYYEKRSWQSSNPIEAAARLIFLNKTCYNGLYRVNSQGEFNVPFGRYKTPRIVNAGNIRAVSQALRLTRANLHALDYNQALSGCKRGDFVYLDPPYHPKSNTSSFTDYTPGGFSEEDQAELAEEFTRLVDKGCMVLLSNSETVLTRMLYHRYHVTSVVVNRPISCVGTRRTGYGELIVLGIPR